MTAEDGTYCIRFDADMPNGVKGATYFSEDGFANIYINPRLSIFEQRATIEHELRHVKRDDAFRENDIRSVEG